jgi:hypothetical protein
MQNQLTPQEFVERWRNTELSERASYQSHFIDLCRMVGYETPTGRGVDTYGNIFTFEYSLTKTTGTHGFADVSLQNHFATEYKAPGKYKDLREAYNQLLQYHENLYSPPLLIVTDIQNWEIHTKWENTESRVYSFTHEEIATRPSVQELLRNIFFDPERLHPRRNTEQVTKDAANVFKIIAENMRSWEAEPQRIAGFLTKLVFCLFAEDISLLPSGPKGEAGIFSEIIEQTRVDPKRFVAYTEQLFKAMADGGDVLFKEIPYFDGAMFENVRVEELSLEALAALERASRLNWESVEPVIFGTLFERSLDPSKRAQLGAHYTSREDIQLIVQPVLMRPLEREWERIQGEAAPLRQKYEEAVVNGTRGQITRLGNQLLELRDGMLEQIRSVTVLDPACGSGNFLYVALQNLMTMEKQVIFHPLFEGLPRPFPEVHPRQMYGIEKDEIAHALASIVVWIGWLQWRQQNGYGAAWSEPILQDLRQNIVCMDAVLAYDGEGHPVEPEWYPVDVIIGNPPFLGDKKMRSELSDLYVDDLRGLYDGRVPGSADFVTYWFEQARKHISLNKANRAGLLATNSIRDGANREVLKRIKDSGEIFMAWDDKPWTLEGAAVRVSIVGFDNGEETEIFLNERIVRTINSDLTSQIDITKALQLKENGNLAFIGTQKTGPFDIEDMVAQSMLNSTNLSGYDNQQVVKQIYTATDLMQRPRNVWVIDFGVDAPIEYAQNFELPFEYIRTHVFPVRQENRQQWLREKWWLHEKSRPAMREALNGLSRYICTPRVSKHRVFVWLSLHILPDTRTVVIARQDDFFLGTLQCKIHEVWSLAQASWHGKGNDPTYNAQSCFETFPFPWSPGQEATNSDSYQAISAAAKQLNEERDAWLNPAGVSGKSLNDRTLTNLYNALNVWRGKEAIRTVASAADFAPRLDELHNTLDRAVCDAYGWSHDVLEDEEEILRRLLALNLERAGS